MRERNFHRAFQKIEVFYNIYYREGLYCDCGLQQEDRVRSMNKKEANTIKWEKDTRFCFQEKNGYECTGYYIFLFICPRFTSRVVDRLKEYKIAHRGLGEGVHTFEFVMDGSFFDCFDATKGTKGKVNARVNIVKSSLLMEVRMTIEGTVEAICDRCLEEMELPISGELNLYAKYGEREEGNDDDFIILAQDDDYLDLSEPLYEVYMLNYPLRVVHPEGECNEEMEHVLEELTMEEENDKIDPRWDELRKLINNN